MARQFLRDLVHCQAFHICPIRISCKMLLSRGCGGAESIPLEAHPKKQFVISRLGVKDIRAAISRYDLLIDNNDGTFTSVECESGVLRKGCVLFRVCIACRGHDTHAKGCVGQVDAGS